MCLRDRHGPVALLRRAGESGAWQQHPRAGGGPDGGLDGAEQLRLSKPAGSAAKPGPQLHKLPAALRPAQRQRGVFLSVVLDVIIGVQYFAMGMLRRRTRLIIYRLIKR